MQKLEINLVIAINMRENFELALKKWAFLRQKRILRSSSTLFG